MRPPLPTPPAEEHSRSTMTIRQGAWSAPKAFRHPCPSQRVTPSHSTVASLLPMRWRHLCLRPRSGPAPVEAIRPHHGQARMIQPHRHSPLSWSACEDRRDGRSRGQRSSGHWKQLGTARFACRPRLSRMLPLSANMATVPGRKQPSHRGRRREGRARRNAGPPGARAGGESGRRQPALKIARRKRPFGSAARRGFGSPHMGTSRWEYAATPPESRVFPARLRTCARGGRNDRPKVSLAGGPARAKAMFTISDRGMTAA